MKHGNRFGIFYVSDYFFEDMRSGDEGLNLFKDLIILRAEADWNTRHTRYLATSVQFDKVEDGNEIPEYVAVFYPDSIYPKWVKGNHVEQRLRETR